MCVSRHKKESDEDNPENGTTFFKTYEKGLDPEYIKNTYNSTIRK